LKSLQVTSLIPLVVGEVGALAAAFHLAFSYLNSLLIALLYSPFQCGSRFECHTGHLDDYGMVHAILQVHTLQQNRPLWWLLLAGGKGDDYHMSRSAEHP
jgi:hypothetical protein